MWTDYNKSLLLHLVINCGGNYPSCVAVDYRHNGTFYGPQCSNTSSVVLYYNYIQ